LNIRRRDAFTLIELMVSLVVAGLLMSALVALSGTVQRSFGRSKDIIELQANLRFAMNRMVDDVTRAAYMHSPNPQHAVDGRTLGVIPPSADVAIEYDGPNTPLTLRGNYASSRDYLLDLDDGKIVCRNQAPYNLTTKMCETSLGSYDPYHEPFSDGPGFTDVFCPSELIRLDDGEGHYYYHEVGVATPGDYSLTLQNPSVNRAQLPGRYQWISPITEVIYRLDHDNTYTSPYGAGDPKDRWILVRQSNDCRGAVSAEIAEFLLPPTAAVPGLEIQQYEDTGIGASVGICKVPYNPSIEDNFKDVTAADPVDPLRVRALVITLRGRTEMEDPAMTVVHPEHSIDLDGVPDNGLATVRVERTVVELRNFAITLCL
jgi:prepilin-type N-terminal cleavage/methylation domain-containing protein